MAPTTTATATSILEAPGQPTTPRGKILAEWAGDEFADQYDTDAAAARLDEDGITEDDYDQYPELTLEALERHKAKTSIQRLAHELYLLAGTGGTIDGIVPITVPLAPQRADQWRHVKVHVDVPQGEQWTQWLWLNGHPSDELTAFMERWTGDIDTWTRVASSAHDELMRAHAALQEAEHQLALARAARDQKARTFVAVGNSKYRLAHLIGVSQPTAARIVDDA